MNIERGRAALDLWKASVELERVLNKQLLDAISVADWPLVKELDDAARQAREATNNALAEFHTALEAERKRNGVSGS